MAEIAPFKVTIDFHDDARSNGHLSLFILFNFSLEFKTANCSLFLETFSLVSSVTLFRPSFIPCLFISCLHGHSASALLASSSLYNLILGLLLCSKLLSPRGNQPAHVFEYQLQTHASLYYIFGSGVSLNFQTHISNFQLDIATYMSNNLFKISRPYTAGLVESTSESYF